jgi:hypothetical protein
MNKEQRIEKLSSLIQDPNFVLKVSKTKSNEEAAKLFADNGCEIAADKVKLVRDTLNSLLKGDIKISEDDLENISKMSEKDLENVSGGQLDTTKVLAVALAATVVIGGTAWAVSANSSNPAPQQSSSDQLKNAAAGTLLKAGIAAEKMGRAYAGVKIKPTALQRMWAWVSRDQAAKNAAWDAAAGLL